MRVRLYELGTRTVGVVLIDDFPVSLKIDSEGRLLSCREESGLCDLENCGGQLVFRSPNDHVDVAVNNIPLQEGPLRPGDRLNVCGHQFLVSYEQSSSRYRGPIRNRILP